MRVGRRRCGQSRNSYQGYGVLSDHMFFISGCLLVLIIISCITLTVKAGEKKSTSGYDERYYDELETEYKEGIDQALREYGLANSGINLTKITSADGSRQYSLRIYNARLTRMESDEIAGIRECLCEISFTEVACGVTVSLGE